MVALYIVSAEEAAGKTTISAGLGRYLLGTGKKIGYLKPSESEKSVNDGDIAFMREVLGLSDAVNAPDIVQGRDVVLVEAMLGSTAEDTASRAVYGAAREMKAKAVAVETFSGDKAKFIDVYKGFGENLAGVIINKVPASRLEEVREGASKQLEAAGINLLGVIPEDRALLTITVGELAEIVEGEILNNAEESTGLVENFMLGAMVVDSGLDYFGRKSNKAAIIRGDRPDMQLAALETSTRCLVLSSAKEAPIYNVREKAENRGIPVITTGQSAEEIINGLETALGKTRFHQEAKLTRLAGIMQEHLSLQALV